MNLVFHDLGKNILRSFSKKNLPWHLLAILLTAICVLSGFDWYYHLETTRDTIQALLFPAVVIGGILPLTLPIVLLIIGPMINNRKTTLAGLASAHAAFVGWLISSTYKAFTGRIEPPFRFFSEVDISRNFNFGFLEHGIFWGWPSSHTTVAFSVALAIWTLYPENKFIKYFALLVALYVGIGISVNIHWFSDFIAGAIIGSVIGLTVGKSFSQLLNK